MSLLHQIEYGSFDSCCSLPTNRPSYHQSHRTFISHYRKRASVGFLSLTDERIVFVLKASYLNLEREVVSCAGKVEYPVINKHKKGEDE